MKASQSSCYQITALKIIIYNKNSSQTYPNALVFSQEIKILWTSSHKNQDRQKYNLIKFKKFKAINKRINFINTQQTHLKENLLHEEWQMTYPIEGRLLEVDRYRFQVKGNSHHGVGPNKTIIWQWPTQILEIKNQRTQV